LRPFVKRTFGAERGSNADVLAISVLDLAAVLLLFYFSGGFWNPYEEYVYASLIVPAFLNDRRASFGLLAAFLAGLVAVIWIKAGTIDGPWFHGSVPRFASIIIVPILVVVAVQFLSQLTRRLQEQRERARKALAENVRLQREREQLAAQAERTRISREIHDGIAQSIYMLSLNLEKAADLAPPSESANGLRGLVGLAKASLLEVRQYIFDLKPLLAGESGLVEALRGQVKEFSAVSGVPVEVSVSGSERRLPMEASATMYRIAQEALANAFRHAEASHIGIHISFASDSVSLRVSDDGLGFTNDREGGNGLRNMRQRAERLGGHFRVTSEHGAGTAVDVSLPASST
jgi:signal transduction histidine kinase